MPSSSPAAQAAWANATALTAEFVTTSEGGSHHSTFTNTVGVTATGQLLLCATVSNYETLGISRTPNQFDRNPGRPWTGEPRYAFIEPFVLAGMGETANKAQPNLKGRKLPREFAIAIIEPISSWGDWMLQNLGRYLAGLT